MTLSQPSSNVVLRRTLIYGSILAAVVAVGGVIIGILVSGSRGAIGAVIGAAMALVFLGITAASILFANRFAKSDFAVPAFFGVVLGGWLLKFVAFLILAVALRDQPWLDPIVLFVTLVVAVIGSLAVDVIVVARSRMPVVSDLAPSRRID